MNDKEAQLQDTERQLAGLKGTAEKYVYINAHKIRTQINFDLDAQH